LANVDIADVTDYAARTKPLAPGLW